MASRLCLGLGVVGSSSESLGTANLGGGLVCCLAFERVLLAGLPEEVFTGVDELLVSSLDVVFSSLEDPGSSLILSSVDDDCTDDLDCYNN